MAQQGTTDVRTKILGLPGLYSNQKKGILDAVELNPKIVYASSDHTVNPSITLANDSELYFDVKAGRKYIFEGFLKTTVNGTDGILVAFATSTDVTSGFAMYEYALDGQTEVQTETQTDFTSPSVTGIAAAITQIRINGFIKAAADGRFNLQTALKVDNNAVTTVHLGSYLKIYEVA